MNKPQSAGAAWKKTISTKNGEVEVFNVIIGEKKYTMWPNQFKKDGEKTPDYRLTEDNYKPSEKPAKVENDLPF